MCRLSGKMSERQMNGSKKNEKPDEKSSASIDNGGSNNNRMEVLKRRRRSKYDREGSEAMLLVRESYLIDRESSSSGTFVLKKTKKKSKLSKRHEKDSPSGGMEALIPSLIGVIALVVIVMGKMGFRGRASVAGIDLGTTNSVICVQQQSKGVGQIECIPDPYNDSPIIPSVISFLDNTSTTITTTTKKKKKMEGTTFPVDPSHVIVGSEAKSRIDSHPHHTLYHAKRVIAQSFSSNTVKEMMEEVEFHIVVNETDDAQNVLFRVPFHGGASVLVTEEKDDDRFVSLSPQQVGSYVVNHLIQLTQDFLGHENVKSAVIAVPAKFDRTQRDITVEAFKKAGVTVTRILEEPVAAALAYGLQKKENVDYIMVYDFGGGTLDVSILHVAEGGYVEVMGSDGDEHLGGADFDAAVAHLLLNKYDTGDHHMIQSVTNAIQNLALPHNNNNDDDDDDTFDVEEQLATSCPKLKNIPLCTLSSFHTIGEKIKIQLSSFPNGGATVKESCYGLSDTSSSSSSSSHDTTTPSSSFEDFCTQLEIITMEVSSSEYDSVCQSLYHRSMIPIRTLLNDLNIEPDEVDEVVMVGGTTRMPKIRTMVQEELGVSSLNTEIDPDITVAYGAASVID